MRFTKPLRVDTLTPTTVTLRGPLGAEGVTVVGAEGGRLLFVTPAPVLFAGARYTLALHDAVDLDGLPLPATSIHFATIVPETVVHAGEGAGSYGRYLDHATHHGPPLEDLIGQPAALDAFEWTGPRRDGKPFSRWQALAPFQAPRGVTALAGQVLRLNGEPLPDVTLQIGVYTTVTDRSGRFLLQGVPAGPQVFVMDGSTASSPGRTYATFDYALDVTTGRTNVLPFTIWLPLIDTEHGLRLPVPTTQEIVVTTPLVPGLEARIPAGVSLQTPGGPLKALTLTRLPVDRTPFPLMPGTDFFFTPQAHGALVTLADGTPSTVGVRFLHPNVRALAPGTRVPLFAYDTTHGHHEYGEGSVSADGRQIIPAPGVQFLTVTCAEELGGDSGPDNWGAIGGPKAADPVDLATGLFVYRMTDLVIPDVIPIVVTRTYRTNDRENAFRPFGIASHPYAVYLTGDTATFQYADLILEDGARVRYYRTSPGTDYASAVMAHTTTPTRFYQSTLAWKILPSACPGCAPHAVWELRFRDGLLWRFPGTVQPPTDPGPALESIVDRNGNTLTVTRDATFGTRKITRLTSPNGRWIDVTTDGNVRITQLRDHIGRTVGYAYDGAGNLSTVTDVRGGVTQYTYDASHRLLTIRDARGVVYLTNEYDANGRVSRQTLADGGVYAFSYTPWSSPPPPPPSLTLTQYIWPDSVFATEMTDPRGTVHRYEFFGSGYPQRSVRARGLPEEQTTQYERDAVFALVTAIVDPLARRTELGYDGLGNLTTRRDAVGTSLARTLTATYEPTFSQPTSVTDALGHTWTATYDATGHPLSATDPLGNKTSATYDAQGNLATLTDPLANVWTFTSEAGSVTSVKNPLNQTATAFRDAVGRVVSLAPAAGRRTRAEYDPANQLTRIVDPLGGPTQLTYDANGNVTALADARGNATGWSLDSIDRVATRTDPLGHSERSTYDPAGDLRTFTDRKGQLTTVTRDALGRPTLLAFADGSTRSYAWDAGDRLTAASDSQTGALARTWDVLDRLVQETTPQGSVAYTYDAADRRTGLTVSGQAPVTYSYDAADRLTRIVQGTATVTVASDAAGRRTSLALPNGVSTTYGYDKASRLTSLTYKKASTTLGTLTYTYDADGNRTALGGTWARTGQPAAMAGATYDAANRQLTFGTATLAYDTNGNLTTITDASGVTALTWDARDRLGALAGPGGLAASFADDALARRVTKTLNGTTTTYLYDGLDAVREITNGVPVDYLRSLAIDEPLTRSGSEFYLADVLGSIVALTGPTGSVTTAYTYEAFGSATTAGTVSANAVGFTGRETDGTGLDYYRARYYHPDLSRFVSEDPIDFGGGDFNLYAYVSNRPTSYADPTGELVPAIVGGCIVGAGTSIGFDVLARRKIDLRNAVIGCVIGGIGGGTVRLLGPRGDVGTPKVLQRYTRPYLRLDPPHHGKGWELDGTIPKYFRRWFR